VQQALGIFVATLAAADEGKVCDHLPACSDATSA
jgi:hypothetical protein